MKKTSISLLVSSPSMSLDELSARLGRSYSKGSHSKGEVHAGARLGSAPWPYTIWRMDSGAVETASVEVHLERLEGQFPPEELKRVVPDDCGILIDIAIFFDTLNVSATLSRRALKVVENYKADLEISCYPSS
jgi:hypothetical protein